MKKGSAGTLLPEAGRDKRQGEAPPRRRADSAFPSANGSRPKPRAADRTALSALQSVQALAHRRFDPRLVQPALGQHLAGLGVLDIAVGQAQVQQRLDDGLAGEELADRAAGAAHEDRKSTRLNSSHVKISYAVFCLKKKNN